MLTAADIDWSPHTSVKWQTFDYYLRDHPDRETVRWCINGFKHGFSLGLEGVPTPGLTPPNSKRVLENPAITWELINDKIDKGFIIGHLKTSQSKI